MSDALSRDVAALLADGARSVADAGARAFLQDASRRLGEPLRVAIAGKVKAGKSTLLNALVGEELAPTDAGECTKVVTWYADGHTYRVLLHPKDAGPPQQRPFRRPTGALEVDLGGFPVDEVDHLEVWWPSRRLRELTLIDTPGIASLSTDVAARTHRFLTPGKERPTPADAVVYLLRHVHTSDVRFLEAFHDDQVASGGPVTAVGVLSRADEVGACGRSAMEAARRVATRYQSDPQLARLCHRVVPVAGLVAQAGETLREEEFRALAKVAAAPREVLAAMLLSADRFGAERPEVAVPAAERRRLLGRLGLFGVRIGVDLVRTKAATTSPQLAAALVRHSGVEDLRAVLLTEFAERSRVLKARSALAALGAVLAADRSAAAERLRAEAERIASGAHEFAEVRLLGSVRAGELELRPRELGSDQLDELRRLVGGSGSSPAARLGLPPDAAPGELRAGAADASRRWTRVAEHPLSSLPLRSAARVVVRSCEGLLAELAELPG